MRVLCYERDSYQVRATTPRRSQDVARFEVQKQGKDNTYTVTFQTRDGSKGQCSCPAGKTRKTCRHQKMLREFAAKVAAPPPQQTLPFPQASQKPVGPDPATEYQGCRKQYAELRTRREGLAKQLAEIDVQMKRVETRGKTLKAELEKGRAAA